MFTDLLADRFAAWQSRLRGAEAGQAESVVLPPPAPSRPRPRQWQCFGFALGVFGAALMSPATGWILRQEIRFCDPGEGARAVQAVSAYGSMSADHGAAQKRLDAALARLTEDVNAQTANALITANATFHPTKGLQAPLLTLWDGHRDGRAIGEQNLWRIMQRFPNSPVPCAGYLANALYRGNLNGRQTYARYMEAVSRGERLAPDNAFFSCMRINGDFAARDPNAALRDLDIASRKSHWNDYGRPIMQGIWQLNDAYTGMSNSQSHLSLLNANGFWNYPRGDSFAMNLMLISWQREEMGDRDGAEAIRGRLMRLAVTTQGRASGFMAQPTGTSLLIEICFANRPGRAYEGYAGSNFDLEKYPAILRRYGYEAEAQWAQPHLDAALTNQFAPLSSYSWYPRNKKIYNPQLSIGAARGYWIAGLCAWVTLALVAVTGCVAGVINFRRRFSTQRPRSLSVSAVTGIGIGLLLAGCTLYALRLLILESVAKTLDSLPLLCVVCVLPLVIGLLRETRVTSRALLLTYGSVCGAALGVALPLGGALVTAYSLLNREMMTLSLRYEQIRSALTWSYDFMLWLLAALLVASIVAMILGQLKRVPATSGLWRGLSTVLLPILSLLLAGSAALALATARAEARADQVMLRMLDSEDQVKREFVQDAQRNARQSVPTRALRVLAGDLRALDATQTKRVYP